MARGSANEELRPIRTLYALGSVGGLTDAQLIERFLARDGADREDAFAALVRRHGPMVLGVCRRMLRASADAEDAFQAVFLVLARKAGAVRRRDGLKPWLYGVAVRTAKEARRQAARRRAREGGTMDGDRVVAGPDRETGDLIALLDEELGRLPGRYRDPLLLCELEGVSRRDAALQLGLPEGTLSSRLSRGRSLLRDRLSRRGVALGTGAIAVSLAEPAAAALPGPLAAAAVRLALGAAAGGATVGSAGLLARALDPAAAPWAKFIPAALLASGLLVAALGVWAGATGGANPVEPASPPPALVAAPNPTPEPEPDPDDALPPGATRRFGSSRFRHPSTIEGLAVSPDGTVAVAISGTRYHGAVRAYDLATGRVRLPFDNVGDIIAVAFSPDGKTIAFRPFATSHSSIRLHDATTGKEIARVGFPDANPSSESGVLVFSPAGDRLVVAAATGTALHLIDVARRERIRTFASDRMVYAAAFSPDGKSLVSGGYDNEANAYFARIWEADTGRERLRLPFGNGGIRCAAYSPDGATIVLGGDGHSSPAVKLFDARTGTERLAIPFPEAYSVRSVAFSPDGRTLAASGVSSTRLFDAATGAELRSIDRKAGGLRFAPDGATLVGAVDGTIYRWDAATGRSLIPEGGDSPITQIVATPDGARIVAKGQDGDAHIWDARTGAHLRRVAMSWQRGFALSPDGKFLVWAEADRAILFPSIDRPGSTREGSRLRMMDLATGLFIDRFGGFEGDGQDVFFPPDGRTVVTADRYGQEAAVRVWDVATGKIEREFPALWKPTGRVWRSRPSPDGKVLAVIYQGEMRGPAVESEVKLWDIATGKELDGPTPLWFDPDVMAFAPGAKTMAVSLPPFGTTIQFRDVATGQVRGEFRGSRDQVTALVLGPDGRLFTGSLDGTVLAWDPGVVGLPAERK